MAKSIRRYELSDSEWERLKPYFEKEESQKRGRPRRNARELLNAILWITHSGAAWRDLPERYGAWQTAYKRFVQWLESGLLEKIFHELSLDADLENISIDSTYIKAHKASAGAQRGDNDPQNPEKSKDHQCIGISRGGRSTKIHAVVDALGNPLHIRLSAGNVNDVTVAQDLLSHVDFRGSTILADKAYSKWAFREYIADHDADFCIPPKSNECDPWYCDWWLYKERHLVENFFLKLKEFRRVATRYDKLARRFLGFVFLACIRILLA